VMERIYYERDSRPVPASPIERSVSLESVIREMTLRQGEHLSSRTTESTLRWDFRLWRRWKCERSRRCGDHARLTSISMPSPGREGLRDAISSEDRAVPASSCPDPERRGDYCDVRSHRGYVISALLALVNPGDEVIVFEPFYENYGPDATISRTRDPAS